MMLSRLRKGGQYENERPCWQNDAFDIESANVFENVLQRK
jgi:hypothetical protein